MSMTDYRRMAQSMDERARQLMNEGVTAGELIHQMVGYLPELNQIWVGATDEELAELCEDYPGFYQYATLMEEGAEAERAKPHRGYDGLQPLNDKLKKMLEQLLTEAAKLEQGYRTAIKATSQPGRRGLIEDLNKRHRKWLGNREKFVQEAKEDGVADKAWEFLDPLINGIVDRIAKLKKQAAAT